MKLIVVIVLLFLVGCDDQNKAQEDWQAEEMLTVLYELKEQLAKVEKQLVSVETDLAELKKGAARAAPSAVGGAKAIHHDIRLSKHAFRLGDQAAEIAILEFSDFQCPFCARHNSNTLPSIKRDLIDSGKVQYLALDLPLDFHPQAKPAAIAARCAGEQGQYWPMRDQLFASLSALSPSLYVEKARELGIDISTFGECVKSSRMTDLVKSDISLAADVGIRGTPNFLIGRVEDGKLIDAVRVSGAQPYGAFKRAVGSMLEK